MGFPVDMMRMVLSPIIGKGHLFLDPEGGPIPAKADELGALGIQLPENAPVQMCLQA